MSITASKPAARREPSRSHRAKRRWRRKLIVIAAPFLVVLTVAIVSYARWMLEPTSMAFGAHSVEWVRADVPFGNSLVDKVEAAYYSAHAPKKGGPSLTHLPVVGPRTTETTLPKSAKQAAVWPPPVTPVFAHPLAGEGAWKPTGPPVDGGPPVLVTTYRPEVAYPELVAYVAWFDHTRTAVAYYPGRYEPPVAAVRGPMMVPVDQRSRLLATFNGGFTFADGQNGSTDNGLVNEPLKDGNATLVGYRDGRIDIVNWSGGPNAGPDVAWTRQSLAPILWNGQLNPGLNTDPNSPQWGYTLGGRVRVWRSAVGIDRQGNLIYVAADGQTVITIAKVLEHLGAVRGMEFDINPEWHTLITYDHRNGLDPIQIGPNPMQSVTRYLSPDDRDFFAVYRRLPGLIAVPFG